MKQLLSALILATTFTILSPLSAITTQTPPKATTVPAVPKTTGMSYVRTANGD